MPSLEKKCAPFSKCSAQLMCVYFECSCYHDVFFYLYAYATQHGSHLVKERKNYKCLTGVL